MRTRGSSGFSKVPWQRGVSPWSDGEKNGWTQERNTYLETDGVLFHQHMWAGAESTLCSHRSFCRYLWQDLSVGPCILEGTHSEVSVLPWNDRFSWYLHVPKEGAPCSDLEEENNSEGKFGKCSECLCRLLLEPRVTLVASNWALVLILLFLTEPMAIESIQGAGR